MIKSTINNDAYIVSRAEMINILLGTVRLARMHLRLIDLHEEESRLKKHHKPYLHIREYADEICKEDEASVASIINSIFPGADLRDPKTIIPGEVESYFDTTSCRDCRAFDVCKSFMGEANSERDNNEEDFHEELMLVPVSRLAEMLEDVCDMGSIIDDLLEVFEKLMKGETVSEADLMRLLIEAEGVSDEIYAKWGDEELRPIQ